MVRTGGVMLERCGSGELFQPDPIQSIIELDLGVLAVADIPVKNACTALPANGVAGAPSWGDPTRRYRSAASVALAGPAGLATGQSCSTGHFFSPLGRAIGRSDVAAMFTAGRKDRAIRY